MIQDRIIAECAEGIKLDNKMKARSKLVGLTRLLLYLTIFRLPHRRCPGSEEELMGKVDCKHYKV
jgi:hypothetical protein